MHVGLFIFVTNFSFIIYWLTVSLVILRSKNIHFCFYFHKLVTYIREVSVYCKFFSLFNNFRSAFYAIVLYHNNLFRHIHYLQPSQFILTPSLYIADTIITPCLYTDQILLSNSSNVFLNVLLNSTIAVISETIQFNLISFLLYCCFWSD